MKKPVISVVTPAYNVESYLSEAINSVLAQTFTDFEYLIIDDGSTDNTLAIARSFALKEPRIRVISQPNGGSSSARNTGIKKSQGDYISFIDGDDIWHPNKLMVQLKQIKLLPNHFGAVFCWSEIIDRNGQITGKKHMPLVGTYDLYRLLEMHCPPGNGSCLLIRRQCFDEAGLFDEKLRSAVDFEMWVRITRTSLYPYFQAFPNFLVKYRARVDSLSKQYQQRLDSVEVVLNRYTSDLTMTPREKARIYVYPALLAFRQGDDKRTLQWSRIAKGSGLWYLLHLPDGRRFLLWSFAGKNLVGRVKKWLNRDCSPRFY